MSEFQDKSGICSACGLPLDKNDDRSDPLRLCCGRCTEDHSREPDFETVVTAMAVGYFMKVEGVEDPIASLKRARRETAGLPTWRERKGLPKAENMTIIRLTSAMQEVKKGQFGLEMRDFFVSHRHDKSCDEEVVIPLIEELKSRGFTVWWDGDEWKKAAGSLEEWERKGIVASRHFVPVLCQGYFDGENTLKEFELAIREKGDKHVIPIWFKDVDDTFIKTKGVHKSFIQIVGLNWNDYKGKIPVAADLVQGKAMIAEGFRDYRDVKLADIDARLLEQIESQIRESIPIINGQVEKTDRDSVMPSFGFTRDERTNRLTGIFLADKGLRSLPSYIGACTALESLNLSGCNLTELPDSFERLKALQRPKLFQIPS